MIEYPLHEMIFIIGDVMRNQNRKAFTTVELVIVIAVIAVLATVLVPVFSNLITKANDSEASQNALSAYKQHLIERAAEGELSEYYLFAAAEDRVVVLHRGAAVGIYENREAAMTALFGEQVSDCYAFGTGTEFLFAVLEGAEKQLVMDYYKVEDASSLQKDKCKRMCAYSNLSMFAHCDIIKLQLYVGSEIAANRDYTFDIQVLDVSGTFSVKKTYTLKVSGRDILPKDWNTFDVSHLGIRVGEGETLGFGGEGTTLPTYFSRNEVSPALNCLGSFAVDGPMNLLVGVIGVERPVTEHVQREQLQKLLQGKYLSVLGDDVCTYDGYSYPTASLDKPYYPKRDVDSVEKTFWVQLIDALDMRLLVNNSWSGSKILDSMWKRAGCRERPTQLHADGNINRGKTPDVIVSFMGNNDYFADDRAVGTVNADLFAWVEQIINGGSGGPNTFAEGYALMVAKMRKAYPNAKIFLFNMVTNETHTLEKAERYNAIINAIAEQYGCYVADLTHSVMSGTNYEKYASGDNLKLNAAGMDVLTELLIEAMADCYLQGK